MKHCKLYQQNKYIIHCHLARNYQKLPRYYQISAYVCGIDYNGNILRDVTSA